MKLPPDLDIPSCRVGVTGHQPFILGGYGEDVAERLTAFAREWLELGRPKEVISGLAAGWDTAVAEAAVEVSVPLVAALAFRAQADHWPPAARAQFERLVAASSEVYLHAPEKCAGVWTARDHWVLERSDVVLALWSGIEGGTGRAVRKAGELGRPVINVWDDWAAMKS